MAKFVKYFSIVLVIVLIAYVAVELSGRQIRASKYSKPVAIEANYVKLDCGKSCVALEVKTVSGNRYPHIVGLPIYPYSEAQNIEAYILRNVESGQTRFCVKGYLHKFNKGFLRLFVAGGQGYPFEVTAIEVLKDHCTL
jgi:hypothetical protein